MASAPASRRSSATIRNIRLTALFRPEDIVNPAGAATEREAVRRLLEHLALNYGIGNINLAMDEVMACLEKDDIRVRPGLTVLYGRLEKVTDPLIAMSTFEKPIAVAGENCRLLIVALLPMDMPGGFRQIRQGLAKACEDEDAAGKIASLKSPLAVWQHFDAGGHHLPDHLDARHIMSSVDVYLDDHDSLARAIDLFLAHRVSELPVLNSDRELMGVVTTKELVKVCMPEYLMWVEDMTPFLNFEPIAEIIRNESSTWLREIMIHDYAQVAEDSPAILALKEISRHDTDNAYVIRERKLVGVIKLHEFLSSILR